jgi:dTMP kinase
LSGRGYLIALEGGEACGKTTQARLLAEALGTVPTREPGGSALGEAVRALLLEHRFGPIAPRTELLLFLAQRAEHVAEVVIPELEKGHHVVTDRFSASTIAYQGYGRGLSLDEVRQGCDLATGGLWPDLSILLEVPPRDALLRRVAAEQHDLDHRGRPDRIEAEGECFHEAVARGFATMATSDPERWLVVDGTGPTAEVAARIRSGVGLRLGVRFR